MMLIMKNYKAYLFNNIYYCLDLYCQPLLFIYIEIFKLLYNNKFLNCFITAIYFNLIIILYNYNI